MGKFLLIFPKNNKKQNSKLNSNREKDNSIE